MGDRGDGIGALTTRAAASRLRRLLARRSLAFLSPLPRQPSGVSGYAMSLLPALAHHFRIDIYHDEGLDPDLGKLAGGFTRLDHRQFERRDRVFGYAQILSQMGNSHLHGQIYDRVLAHGGVVTLHDLYLGGFHWWRAHQGLAAPATSDDIAAYFRQQIRRDEPGRLDEAEREVLPWVAQPETFQRKLREYELPLHRTLTTAADAVIVHSEWARQRIVRAAPELAERVHVVLLGADPAPPLDPRARRAVRTALDLPPESLLIASFGILHAQKMNVEAIDAFLPLAVANPAAVLLFVGPEHDGGAARRRARALGLEPDRVRFLGRVDEPAFNALLGAVDIGLNLRRPPTYGESSSALLHLLRHGVPTIVNTIDALAEIPESVILSCSLTGPAEVARANLTHAMRSLMADPGRGQTIGREARAWVGRVCGWPRIASQYAEILARSARGRRLAG